MTSSLQAEILSDIANFAKDKKLLEEEYFQLRAEAIDHIEYHIIDRIDALLKNRETGGQLQVLKLHAENLRQQLEETNARAFQKIRLKISDGSCRGKGFSGLIKKYFDGEEAGDTTQQKIGYDNLDLFINGILGYGKPPAETRERESEMVFYQKTPVRIVLEIVKRAAFIPEDVFFDLGSGLGQVVILIHLLSGIVSKGVEFEPAFCDYARDISAELRLPDVQFINTDARLADYSSGTVFFMYTPFDGSLFHAVLKMLKAEADKRSIKLFSYGPCTAVLAQESWLIRRSEIQFGPAAFGDFISI